MGWHGNLLSNFHPLGRAVYFYFSALRLSSSVYVFFLKYAKRNKRKGKQKGIPPSVQSFSHNSNYFYNENL